MFQHTQPGDIVFLFGTPNTGKTEVLLNLLRSRPNGTTAVFLDGGLVLAGPGRFPNDDPNAVLCQPETLDQVEAVIRKTVRVDSVSAILCDDVARLPVAGPIAEKPLAAAAMILTRILEGLDPLPPESRPVIVFSVQVRDLIGGGPSLASGLWATSRVVFGPAWDRGTMTAHVSRFGVGGGFLVETYRRIFMEPVQLERTNDGTP